MSTNALQAHPEWPSHLPAQRSSKQAGVRADALLVQQGLAPSRAAAQRLIDTGRVGLKISTTGTAPIRKASQWLSLDSVLEVTPATGAEYVSRGGVKLAGALDHTGLDVSGWTCLDVGQSTGGFTDCLLQAGAARVVGVDVGHGQLDARLRADARVVCLEGINARALTPTQLGSAWPAEGFDLIVADVSFISLTLVIPRLPALVAANGRILLLVKPQFEVGRQGLGKGGVVRDSSLYAAVEAKLRQAASAAGLSVQDWFASPIPGGDGNREFFLYARLLNRPPGE